MESDDVYSIIASGPASAGKLIAQLVTDERDLNEPGPDGMCLLHVAATYGHAEIVATLVCLCVHFYLCVTQQFFCLSVLCRIVYSIVGK
jgi:hypothetical protein